MNLQNELIERYVLQFPNSEIGKCLRTIERAAHKKINILIQGETGTGKTTLINLVSKKLFEKRPLITVSCFNLSGDLFQSVLCGHLKGAFTGAVETTEGKAQAANNGALFFDDVDTLTTEDQSKLLYFLDYRVCEKVGSTISEALDLWTAFSTNSCLQEKIRDGFMREDFYYRISTIKVNVPPLRERPNFIKYFIKNYLERLDISCGSRFINECLEYPWHGNIRELTSALDRIQILNREGFKKVSSLTECGINPGPKISLVRPQSQGLRTPYQPYLVRNEKNNSGQNRFGTEPKQGSAQFTETLRSSNEDIFDITSEKNRIMHALKKARYKRSEACRILDISYSTLWRKLKQYDIYEKLR